VNSLDEISALIGRLHGSTSRDWNLQDGTTGQRRVWYKFADRATRGERHYDQALNNIHINPVKHGYVADVYEWSWSSVHEYLETLGRDWLRDKWRAHALGDFGKGWD
jgi:putative transposase